uniref:NAD-dependent epimerase/dehydratase family protein n=1 Tax=candidate division WOR-3 bacterium TaxID=2052148 RepID=A0A7C3N7C6_UNCW3
MKKIFVTGSCGFIGSHLVEKLSKYYKVKALVYYNSSTDIGNLKYLKNYKNIEIEKGDIRDYQLMYSMTKDVDCIINLAALITIPYSFRAVDSYIETNIKGVKNILDVAKERKIKHTIIMSTSEVYGSAQYTPMDEKHPLNAYSPYAATKIAQDQMALAYSRVFSLPVTIVRPFNIFGPRQSLRSVLPQIILQSIKSDKIYIGNLHTERDYTYIDDLTDAFTKVIYNEKTFGKIFNICSKKSYSIKNIIKIVESVSNKKLEVVVQNERVRKKSCEVDKLLGDNSFAKKLIGYSPKVSFEEGIEKTYRWFSENYKDLKRIDYEI